jgi:trehalose 6-phosphate synthase
MKGLTMLQQQGEASPAQNPSESILAARLILVTNRGPVEYDISQGKKLKRRRGAGGVVTALTEAINRIDTTWVALAMTEGDRQAIQEAENGLLPPPAGKQNMQLHYVAVPKRVYHQHYNVISNQVLWFLQHYLDPRENGSSSSEQIRKAWENGYVRVNQAIADAVSTEIERGEGSVVVMLHDYHLYLASAMIRERHPSVTMQQFIHIPWPEVRYWQYTLPGTITEAIFRGLLGNDIIGFQTRRDAQNFIEGAGSLLNDVEIDTESGTITHDGRRTLVRDYPISISVTEERRTVESRAGKRAAERIRPLLGEQTIMRVDRIEPTKNIIKGFQAYAYLLEHHPELHEKVKFLAFLVPSRQTVPAYRRYQQEVLKLVEEINQQYSKNGWTPIQAFVQNDRTLALAAMQFYDALLVNSLFDGMNLVAKEGAIVNKKDGVLVLSRTSGAFQQLENASIPISPGDTVETAEALYTALTLPPEERRRLSTLAREEVERNDLRNWIAQQVRDINSVIEHENASGG